MHRKQHFYKDSVPLGRIKLKIRDDSYYVPYVFKYRPYMCPYVPYVFK